MEMIRQLRKEFKAPREVIKNALMKFISDKRDEFVNYINAELQRYYEKDDEKRIRIVVTNDSIVIRLRKADVLKIPYRKYKAEMKDGKLVVEIGQEGRTLTLYGFTFRGRHKSTIPPGVYKIESVEFNNDKVTVIASKVDNQSN